MSIRLDLLLIPEQLGYKLKFSEKFYIAINWLFLTCLLCYLVGWVWNCKFVCSTDSITLIRLCNSMLYYSYEMYSKVELVFLLRKLWDHNLCSQQNEV